MNCSTLGCLPAYAQSFLQRHNAHAELSIRIDNLHDSFEQVLQGVSDRLDGNI